MNTRYKDILVYTRVISSYCSKMFGMRLKEMNNFPEAYPLQQWYDDGIHPEAAARAAGDIALNIGLQQLGLNPQPVQLEDVPSTPNGGH